MPEDIDSAALLLAALNEIRSQMRDHRALLREAIDQGRTFERHVELQLLALNQRIGEIRDDLRSTIHSEVMGLVGELERRDS